jgi:hypothetical protein
MSDAPVDLAFIARQQEQILAELGTMRDDAGVLLAIVMRIDGTVTGLVREIGATHAQHSRLASRAIALEKSS